MSLTVLDAERDGLKLAWPFNPSAALARVASGAQGFLANDAVRIAVQAALAGGTMAAHVVSAPVLVPVAAMAAAFAASHAHVSMPVGRSQDMAIILTKRLGFPVAALSDVLDVERKTVYDWLNKGSEAGPETAERLRLLTEIFQGEEDGSLRYFHRFWKRTVPHVGTLQGELTSPSLDTRKIKAAVNALRPAVRDSMAYDRARQSVSSNKASSRDSIPGMLEAVSRE